MKVMVTDLSAYKLERAGLCGLSCAINPREQDLGEAIQNCLGPDRADVIFECVGVESTITDAVKLARKGSTIVVVGVFGKKPQVDLGLVQDRELTLVGTLMYQRADYLKAIEFIAAGQMVLDPLISSRFSFERYLDAYHTIEAAHGDSMKVMIEL